MTPPGEQATVVRTDALGERIAAGDAAAEREFVERYQRSVLVIVRRHSRPNEPAVEDMAQDVLMSVLQKLRQGGMQDIASLPAYLRSAAVLTVQAEYRRRQRRESLAPMTSLPETESVPSDNAPIEPPDAVHRMQMLVLINRLVRDLPEPRDREILRRFYVEEQDRDQVCEALNIDADHFRKVLFRARQRFAALLRAQGVEDVR